MRNLRALALSTALALGSAYAKSEWKPLFDGRTWTGWHIVGAQNYWKIEPSDSSISGYSLTNTPFTMVFTDKTDFDQFTIKYQYRLKAGCSGFFFRSKEQPSGALVKGMQVEAKYLANGHSEIGSLYCHECNDASGTEKFNGWVDQHVETYSDAVAKTGDAYQQVYLTVKRPYIYVNVNGSQAIGETEPAKLAQGAKPARDYVNISILNSPGQIGLQIHGSGSWIDVRFKDIQILHGCNDSASVNYSGKFVAGTSNKHPAYYQDNGSCTGTGIDPAKARDGAYFGSVNADGGSLELEIRYPGAHTLDIINLDGKILFSGSAPAAHTYRVTKALEAGIYLARIKAGGQSAARKVVVP